MKHQIHLHRILTSNWISCLFWFGDDEVGIRKNAKLIFSKEAKAVPIVSGFQLRSHAGCGGECYEFKRAIERLK